MQDKGNDDTQGMHRIPDHQTSIDAAEAASAHRGTDKARVLLFLQEDGDMTDEELADAFARRRIVIATETPRKRRTDLYQAGLVVDSGVRRRSRYGREMIVWHAIAEGELDLFGAPAPSSTNTEGMTA